MPSSSSGWRQRRRRASVSAETSSDDSKMMDTLSLDAGAGGAAAVDATFSRHGRRFASRHAKRARLVDLESLEGPAAGGSGGGAGGGMFGKISLAEVHAAELEEPGDGADPADRHTGSAVLCWLSDSTCIGLIKLDRAPGLGQLRLHAAEAATRCTRALCGANDCCEEQAFVVQLQAGSSSRRSFIARRTGVGDYVVLTGRHLHFDTDYVPGEALRDQAISRYFGHLPDSVRTQAVLCIGRVSFTWQHLCGSDARGEPSSALDEALSAGHPESISMAEEPSSAPDDPQPGLYMAPEPQPGLYIAPGSGVCTAPGSSPYIAPGSGGGDGTSRRSTEGGAKSRHPFSNSSSSNGGGGGGREGALSPARWNTGGGGNGGGREGTVSPGGVARWNTTGGGIGMEGAPGRGGGDGGGGAGGGGGDALHPHLTGMGWLDWSCPLRTTGSWRGGDVPSPPGRDPPPGGSAFPPPGIPGPRGQSRFDFVGLYHGRSPAGSSHAEAAREMAMRGADAFEQEGYAGDKSSDASSENELASSVRSILPLLARVAMPTPGPEAFGFEELIARGGTPFSADRPGTSSITMDDFDF